MKHDESVTPSGVYEFTCWESTHRRRLKWQERIDNLVVDTAKNDYLDARFNSAAGAQASTWYIGLIANSTGNITLNSTDTLSAHGGWTESTAYTEGTRQTWNSGAAGSTAVGAISNSSSVATFTLEGGSTIGGAFQASTNTKGGTGGLLQSESKFSQTRNPSSGDTLDVTITQKAT